MTVNARDNTSRVNLKRLLGIPGMSESQIGTLPELNYGEWCDENGSESRVPGDGAGLS